MKGEVDVVEQEDEDEDDDDEVAGAAVEEPLVWEDKLMCWSLLGRLSLSAGTVAGFRAELG